MLDLSPAMIADREHRFGIDFWQLRTPLTRNRLAGRPYGLDNGCFTKFNQQAWMRMLNEARSVAPQFVCLPDIVGDARRTLELFEHFLPLTEGLPRALVLQDGIGDFAIPWHQVDALFVGGTDTFKIAPECINACRAGQLMGKYIHVGRVNTPARLSNWIGKAQSIDGSGISKYDHMLGAVVSMLRGDAPSQQDIFESPTTPRAE